MKEFTVPMALVDFIPVVLFFLAFSTIYKDLKDKVSFVIKVLLVAGGSLVTAAGGLKATYKLLYALNVGDAMSEAYHTLRLLKEVGPNFQLGVWFDMEDADGYKLRNGFFDGNQATKEVDISEAYLNIMSSNGYHAGLYASLSWLEGDLNSPKIEGYDKWVAHWNGPVTYDSAKQHSTSYSKPYRYWQFCSDGHIPGVRGGDYDDVDLDLGYNIFI